MARWRWLFWGLPVVGLLLAFAPLRGGPGVEIIGDGREAVLSAVAEGDPVDAVLPLDVVLLRRIENLRHVPEVAALCRGACTGAVTVLIEFRPGGPRKVLVVDLDRFEGAAALDRGSGLPKPLARCVADMVRAEARAIIGRPEIACAAPRRGLWRLPFGL